MLPTIWGSSCSCVKKGACGQESTGICDALLQSFSYIVGLPSCNISLNTETIHLFIVDLWWGLFAHPFPLQKSSRSIQLVAECHQSSASTKATSLDAQRKAGKTSRVTVLAFSSLRSLKLQVPAGGERSVGELLSSCQQGLQASGSESEGCLPVWQSMLRFAGAFFRNQDLALMQLPSTTPSDLPSCFSLALLAVSLLLMGPRHLINKLPRAQLRQRLWLHCCKFPGSVLRKRLQNRRLRSSLFVYGWFWGTQKQPSSL